MHDLEADFVKREIQFYMHCECKSVLLKALLGIIWPHTHTPVWLYYTSLVCQVLNVYVDVI